jgi:enamine deaminase RidA (YjgF/YER057c/UK114 family)
MRILQPPGWARPKGYSNGIAVKGSMVFVSGTVGWNEEGKFEATDFAAQARQALRNVVEVLKQAGAKPEHIARMNWYVVDKNEYLAAARDVGSIYREIIGKHYPAMTVVEVSALLEDQARLEIEVTAVLPE